MRRYFFCIVTVLLSSLLCANLCFPQRLEEIIKKHTDALGGEDDIIRIKTLFGKAKVRMAGIEAEMKAWWSEPDKVRQEFDFPSFGPLIVADGKSFWTEDKKGEARKLVSYEGTKLLDEVFLQNYVYLSPEKREANLRVGKSRGDPENLVLEFVSQDGELKRLFLDDSTYLLHKYQNFTDGESVTVQLNDYREVGGVMFPF
ncbi:MAG: outer membrane lipoprotein carrier protein LolA, partial [Candidatus Zixiibacteriota bacterium]